MKHFAHLNTAVQVLGLYKGQQPFGIFLKDFFRQDKKYGSKDRRSIGHLCYCYFRLGKALAEWPLQERVVAGLFMCTTVPHELLAALQPAWNEQAAASLENKIALLISASCSPVIPASGPQSVQESPRHDKPHRGGHQQRSLQLQDIFPWEDRLSADIDYPAFCTSFLIQPDLFLRLRPGKEKTVTRKLSAAGIAFTTLAPDCVALPNASKMEELLTINKEVIIQDYSSQRIGEFLQQELFTKATVQQPTKTPSSKHALQVWDCCAASGGKSILAVDKLGNIDLTVSDIRESIIANLRKRFAEAGISRFRSFVADLSNANSSLPFAPHPDLLIADVPCSGSGTWSRTPEQLYYFDTKEIDSYSTLQKKIVTRVIPQLKPGGHLLYITCSVFRQENEDVVNNMLQQFPLELIKMELLKGYMQKADTMFAALLRVKA